MVKKRTAISYYGNTAGARRRQRANLIPGGNIYQIMLEKVSFLLTNINLFGRQK